MVVACCCGSTDLSAVATPSPCRGRWGLPSLWVSVAGGAGRRGGLCGSAGQLDLPSLSWVSGWIVWRVSVAGGAGSAGRDRPEGAAGDRAAVLMTWQRVAEASSAVLKSPARGGFPRLAGLRSGGPAGRPVVAVVGLRSGGGAAGVLVRSGGLWCCGAESLKLILLAGVEAAAGDRVGGMDDVVLHPLRLHLLACCRCCGNSVGRRSWLVWWPVVLLLVWSKLV